MAQLIAMVEGYPVALQKTREWLNGRSLYKPVNEEAAKLLQEKGFENITKEERKKFNGWALTVDKIEFWCFDYPEECEREVLHHILEKKGIGVKKGFQWGKAKKLVRWFMKTFGKILNIQPPPDTVEFWDDSSFAHRQKAPFSYPHDGDHDQKFHNRINLMLLGKVKDDVHPYSNKEMI